MPPLRKPTTTHPIPSPSKAASLHKQQVSITLTPQPRPQRTSVPLFPLPCPVLSCLAQKNKKPEKVRERKEERDRLTADRDFVQLGVRQECVSARETRCECRCGGVGTLPCLRYLSCSGLGGRPVGWRGGGSLVGAMRRWLYL
jgi:hypothetical protein